MMMLSKMMIFNVVCTIPIISTRFLQLLFIVVSLVLSGTLISYDSVVTSVSTEQQQYDYRRGGYVAQRRGNFDQRNMNVDNELINEEQELLVSYNPMRKTTTAIKEITESSIITNQLSRLDDLMIKNHDNDLESSIDRMMITSNVTGCVKNQNQLEMIIMNSPDDSLIPTTIDICKEFITIDASKPNSITGERGIHIIDKFLNIRCIMNRNKKCIIDARKKSRHFYIINSTILLNRITFINGNETKVMNNDTESNNETDVNDYIALGGSLLIDSSNIIINNGDFVNNIVISKSDIDVLVSGAFGGAIVCREDCNMKLMNVNLIRNSASSVGIDGAIFDSESRYVRGGAIASEGNIQMFNVTFINNSASYEGGAIYSESFSNSFNTIEMINVLFTNNTANLGGAFSSQFNNITLFNTTMSNNKALLFGGAIIAEYSQLQMTNSILHNNSAVYMGGALHFYASIIALHNVALTNNSAINGTLALGTTKVDLKNARFTSSITDVDECDLLVVSQTGGYLDDGPERYSRLNLPLSPPPRLSRQRQTKQASIVSIAIQSSLEQQSRKRCVTTYSTLRKQVRKCNNTINMAPCMINICRAQIKMKNMVSESHPMKLSNKNLVINCQLNNNKRCMIDGQGVSQIFYGSNVTVTFRNIIFSNGYSSISGGGALDLTESFVNLFNCSFFNNSAATHDDGAAIMIKNTTLYMSGTKSSFINNTGNSPALVAYSSDLNLYDALFEGNNITNYGKGLFLFDSTIALYNTTFSELKKTTVDNSLFYNKEYDCNVFVAVDPNNFSNGATCLDVSSDTD